MMNNIFVNPLKAYYMFIFNSRFLLDAPESELGDPISLCFLTELAYWFYLDEYAEEDDSLNNLKFDPFAQQLLNVRMQHTSTH